MELIHVAVYGSLRQGFGNHRLLAESELVRSGWLPGFELLDIGPFPGAVRCKSDSSIFVEVYAVDNNTLQKLDHLEGYVEGKPAESLYLRKSYQCANGINLSLYLYNGNTQRLPRIASGDWADKG